MKPQSLYIASDHAGFALKEELKTRMPEVAWQDLGAYSTSSVDYPDFADRLARAVTASGDQGVLICGSGQGMAIRANRYPTIRAALCWSPEVAKLSRQHNDANVLCLAGRLIDSKANLKILKAFLETSFEGGRHMARVEKLATQFNDVRNDQRSDLQRESSGVTKKEK